MIHQCYFAEPQRARLFTSPVYRGFGLYTSVNPDIARNCPELADPRNQPLLCEYAAMLHLWRNPELDPDPWIGFTSYDQLDKFPTIFNNRQEIEKLLAQFDIVGWGGYQFVDAPTGRAISLAEGSERTDMGIVSCLWKLMMMRNELMPQNFVAGAVGLFCDYWVMSKANFNEYMEWSYPLVRWCLTNPYPYIQSHSRSLSHLVERLFILWYAVRGKRVTHVGPVSTMRHHNPLIPQPASAVAAAPAAEPPRGFPHGTNVPMHLAELLRDFFGLKDFIETGSYLGSTAAMMSARFEQVYTVEVEPTIYAKTKDRLAPYKNIKCLQGDTAKQLPQILREVAQPALLWLDAHWSAGDTGKSDTECPVMRELEAAFADRSDHVIMIDDARLFLTPPPPPHDAGDWPTIAQIREFFAKQDPAPYVRVVDDVIVAVPARAAEVVDAYCRERGII